MNLLDSAHSIFLFGLCLVFLDSTLSTIHPPSFHGWAGSLTQNILSGLSSTCVIIRLSYFIKDLKVDVQSDGKYLIITTDELTTLYDPQITHSKNLSSTSPPVSARIESLGNLSSVLETRKQVMKNMCGKYKSGISRTITPDHVKYIYVEDKYKVLYCEVPKSGCSNWKRTLIVLSGKASNPDKLKHEQVHYGGYLKTLNRYNQKEIMHRLQTYKKFMFVREPLDRVVSAYRDKFENPNDYYHNLFGKPIIKKYRVTPSAEALKTGNGVTFKEFVQYLLDGHRPVGMDIHWEQMNKLCHPCLIDYDLIGKFENMEEESNFLLRMIGAPDSLKLPSFKDRNPKDVRTSKEITERYFSQVSFMERQRVYDFYYMDYLMFNYSNFHFYILHRP
uniref:Carbohydrate sulfotransferase n=1 Tax=Fundulus heteroclitus TaxID=8078 RepID=A0A3Q2P8W5_FUNHE